MRIYAKWFYLHLYSIALRTLLLSVFEYLRAKFKWQFSLHACNKTSLDLNVTVLTYFFKLHLIF